MQQPKKPVKFGRYVLLAILAFFLMPHLIPENKSLPLGRMESSQNVSERIEFKDDNTDISYLSSNHTSEIARVGYQFISRGYEKKLIDNISQFFEQHPKFIQRKIVRIPDKKGGMAYKISVTINCQPHEVRKIITSVKNSFGVDLESYPIIF